MTVLVSDSFNRANSSTSPGSTDSYNGGTSKTWQFPAGTVWGISNNQLYPVSDTTGKIFYCAVDAGTANATVSASFAVITNYQNYLILRIQDINNFLFVRYQKASGNLQLIKLVAGAQTTLATYVAGTLANGVTISATANGSSITVSVNGTQVIAATDSTFNTNTLFGLGALNADLTVRYDNFEIDDLNTGQTTSYVGGGSITSFSSLISASHIILSDGNGVNGSSSLTSREIFSYASSGVLQGQSNLLSNEDMVYPASGTLQSVSNLGSGDSYIGASGTYYSGSGSIVSSSLLTSSEIEKYSGSGFMTSFASLMGVEKRITEEKGNILSASLLGVNPVNVVLGVSGDILTNVSLFSGDLLNGMRVSEQFEDAGFVLMHIGLLSRENVFHLYIPHFPVGEIYLLGIMKNTISLEGKQKNTISLNGVMK